jgi:hypothetical protein
MILEREEHARFELTLRGQGMHFNSGTFKKIVSLKELVYAQTHKSD